MSNSNQLSPAEQKALATILGIFFIVLAIVVAIIELAQIVFWISIAIFFLSIGYFIVSLFIDLPRLFNGEDYFDEFPHLLLAIGLLIIFWAVAHIAFPIGYSPTSQEILKFSGQVEEIRGLPFEIQRQALNDICSTTENNPACSMIGTVMNIQEKGEEISDTAKIITWVFKLKVNLPT